MLTLTLSSILISGCPASVVKFPQCSRRCPENCEHCYPGTGVCKKCNEGTKAWRVNLASIKWYL